MVKAMALLAIIFGIMTIISGGKVLTNEEAEIAAGHYVGFVVWFNTIMGFMYVSTGIGLYGQKRWSFKHAIFITVATLLVFAAFGMHILNGGAYEVRTVFAMTFRLIVWVAISMVAYFKLAVSSEKMTLRRSHEG